MRSTTTCLACGKVTISYEPCHSQSLTVPDHDHPTLEETLIAHLGREVLTDEADRCDNCDVYRQRTKTVEVVRWPSVLAVYFNRRYHDGRRWVEVTKHVSFETILNNGAGTLYHLRAVIVHSGSNPNGGHYTAFVRGQDNFWYLCNDALPPCPVSTERVLAAEAFLVFYDS